MKNKKIVVGLSGGVDSSVALILLKKQGWQPIGVSLKFGVWQNKKNQLKENSCCNLDSFKIAKIICQKLNVPYHLVNVSSKFEKTVVNYFIRELKNNHTPNPCLICNRQFKFKELFAWAKKNKINYVATGHYARKREIKNKKLKIKNYQLLLAKDKIKDQTYFLSYLPQKWLKNIIFPLGNYLKKEVYQIAKKQGFAFFLKKKQSQDFCFIANKSLPAFFKQEIGLKKGLIKDKKGNVLAEHQGLHFYTLGQRKGINLSSGPYFVVKKDMDNQTLIVSKNKNDIFSQETIIFPYHFISGKELQEKIKVEVKIRSRHPFSKATLIPLKTNQLKIVFSKKQKAITPGQFAVFYQGNVCLGGGRIIT